MAPLASGWSFIEGWKALEISWIGFSSVTM
jgi:hypothetical protein